MITGAGLLEETGAVSSASADAPAVVVAGALVEGASEAASDSYVSTLAIGIIGAGSADQTSDQDENESDGNDLHPGIRKKALKSSGSK